MKADRNIHGDLDAVRGDVLEALHSVGDFVVRLLASNTRCCLPCIQRRRCCGDNGADAPPLKRLQLGVEAGESHGGRLPHTLLVAGEGVTVHNLPSRLAREGVRERQEKR